MLNISLDQLKIEFNAQPILSAADRAQQKILPQFGAYTRSIAKNSIKTSSDMNKHSTPGSPPIGHSGPTRYKDWIFFFYDRGRKEVVIGAMLLPRKDHQLPPETLERGGKTKVPSKPGYGKSTPKEVTVAPRPHMQPAYDKAVERLLPKLLENSIVP